MSCVSCAAGVLTALGGASVAFQRASCSRRVGRGAFAGRACQLGGALLRGEPLPLVALPRGGVLLQDELASGGRPGCELLDCKLLNSELLTCELQCGEGDGASEPTVVSGADLQQCEASMPPPIFLPWRTAAHSRSQLQLGPIIATRKEEERAEITRTPRK